MTYAQRIGSWKAYPAYSDITEIEKAGNTLYVLASGGLFSYNTNDKSIQTFDKVSQLSDCDITHISWNKAARRLVVTYRDYNIDLIDENGNAVNVADYYNAAITADKTINSLTNNGKYTYLSTKFGVLKLNVEDAEISETYNLGINVVWTHADGSRIYAEASDGCYSASLKSNLLDKSNWQRTADFTPYNHSLDPALLATAKEANPGGPKYNYFGFMKFANDRLYTCGGGYNTSGDLGRAACVQVLEKDKWNIYQDDIGNITNHAFIDLLSVDVNPKDTSQVFASGRTGLYEFRNGKFTEHYNLHNSPLQSALDTNNDYVLVEGITFDDEGNLWTLNSRALNSPLAKFTNNRSWEKISNPTFLDSDNRGAAALQSPIFDSRKLLWFVNNSWSNSALYCYQPETNVAKMYSEFVNEDATKVNFTFVRCVAEDRHKNIWVGTDVGPLELTASEISHGGETFTQVKVPRNDGTDYADYLLSGVDITCIAIDGADRKWFGTNSSGVYLIGADNITQIEHFTKENSPLLSNRVESIAINDKTGTVYFGTDNGLCSYEGDATTSAVDMSKDDVYAYPNPVKPDYTGLITIVGLSFDADVKIVTSNGTLVNQGRSNGGTYTWDGHDLKGRKVASGVYMVLTAKKDGSKGVVSKIAIIN
jgi:hypothetical protein